MLGLGIVFIFIFFLYRRISVLYLICAATSVAAVAPCFWDISGRVLVMQRYIVARVCEKYYFAEQTDVLFIDVNVCLCLVRGRRQTT